MTRNGFGGEERKDSPSCGFLLFEFGEEILGKGPLRDWKKLNQLFPESQKKNVSSERAQKPGAEAGHYVLSEGCSRPVCAVGTEKDCH